MPRTVALVVPAGDAEVAADRLWCAGARAVEEQSGPDGGVVRLITVLAADDQTSLARLGGLPAGWTVEFADAADAPDETWRDFAVPIDVAPGVVVRPAWHRPTGATIDVAIEPAGAFGLGDHPTTQLSGAAVVRLAQPGQRVLDVGCGTGVLAIVALRCGAASATCIDVAAAAVEATRANADANGVGAALDVSATPLADVTGEFDLVLANILAPSLIALADDLRRVTAAGGRLVISGVLADAHDHVLTALAPMVVVTTDVVEGWAAIELRQPDAG